jgi:hydrogenase maturation protein HypF
LETCTKELQERDFQVYYNEAVSCGDGGISLGQAYYGLLQSE